MAAIDHELSAILWIEQQALTIEAGINK